MVCLEQVTPSSNCNLPDNCCFVNGPPAGVIAVCFEIENGVQGGWDSVRSWQKEKWARGGFGGMKAKAEVVGSCAIGCGGQGSKSAPKAPPRRLPNRTEVSTL